MHFLSMQRRSSASPIEDNDEPDNPPVADAALRSANGIDVDGPRLSRSLQLSRAEVAAGRTLKPSRFQSGFNFAPDSKVPPPSRPMSPLESQVLRPAMDSPTENQRRRKARSRNPWSCSLLTLIVTSLGSLALFAIVHSYFTRQIDPQGCKTPRMLPTYIKLLGFDTEHTRFASKYGLYLYRERNVDAYSEEDIGVCLVQLAFVLCSWRDYTNYLRSSKVSLFFSFPETLAVIDKDDH